MAGTGSAVRGQRPQYSLIGPLASMGHAAVVAAGPWMFTVIALMLIYVMAVPMVGLETLAAFRVFIIYAFALSLVVSAPIVVVATRMLADDLYLKKLERVRPGFLAAVVLSTVATSLIALVVYVFFMHPPVLLVVVGCACCALVAMIWVGLAFCGAVRDYRGITTGFLVGLIIAIVGSVELAAIAKSADGMLWAFGTGLATIFFWLVRRVLMTFPQTALRMVEPVLGLLRGLRRYWVLAVGALICVVALWIDKWIMWFGPFGVWVEGAGLVHAPLYDSPMFVAYLTIIPSLSLFVSKLETTFFQTYKGYYDAINNHATLGQIRRNAASLLLETRRIISQIILLQGSLCVIVVLTAPMIADLAALDFRQIGILRFGAVGAFFQFLFLGCSALLLFFERHALFALLQLFFLVSNASLTLVTVALGFDHYGLGYLFACLICGLLAIFALEHTLRRVDYITFVVGNANRRANA